MRYSKYLIIFFILFLPAKLFAQPASLADRDITGLWKGTLYNDTTKKYYRYEIGISEEKGKLSGFSHTFFLAEDKEYYGVKKVKVKKANGKIIIEDAGLIANNYPEAPAKGVRQLNILTLEIKDSVMILSGPFSTNRTKEYRSLTGTISLQRKNDFWQSALVPHLQELGLANDLSFVKKENDLLKEKEAADKIAAQKETVTTNSLQETKKEKADKESTVKTEKIKPEPKTTETAKKTVSNTTVSKQGSDRKIKSIEIKPAEASKEIVSNIAATKQELNKEIKPTESKPVKTSKEIAANTGTTKQETNKEIKSNETVTNTRAKEIKAVEVKSTAPAAEVALRTNVVQQTVYFTSDSLQLSLYDNGEVDGDTVSVLMNGKVIMAKEGLSTNAVRKTIYVSQDNDNIELVMYAENLGSIPPNTGLLVVHDGKNIYEIRFSGDLKKNASIILKRRKN